MFIFEFLLSLTIIQIPLVIFQLWAYILTGFTRCLENKLFAAFEPIQNQKFDGRSTQFGKIFLVHLPLSFSIRILGYLEFFVNSRSE